MGVKGLTNVISHIAPEAMETTKITTLKGTRIAIDMSLVVYQCLISCRFNANAFKDSEGNTTSHISGIFYRFTDYIAKGLIPIAVFDGKPPDEKKATIDSRNKGVKDSKDKIEELKKLTQTKEIVKQIEDLDKKTIRMTFKHGEDLKQLLTLMGIKWYQADGEAEAGCVWLVKNKYADNVMTEDMDTLPLGAPTLVRRKVSRSAKKDEIVIFHLDKILEKFELTMDQFIDMCLLCGTDYTPSIPRIGSRTALTHIRNNGSLMKTLDNLRSKPSTSNYIIPSNEFYQNAKNIFLRENNDIFDSNCLEKHNLVPVKKANLPKLREYLLSKNFNETRINNAIKKAY